MKRVCKECGIEKDITNFPSAGIVKGKKYYRYRCIPCNVDFKQRTQKSSKTAKRQVVNEYKMNNPCIQCGYDDYRALQFHHLRDKKYNISDMLTMGLSLDKIMEEISKCVVLCANCHQIESFAEKQKKGSEKRIKVL